VITCNQEGLKRKKGLVEKKRLTKEEAEATAAKLKAAGAIVVLE
jgi:ribosomal protein L7/L12